MVQLKNLIMLSLSRRIGVNDSTVQSELEVTYEFSTSTVPDCITSLPRRLIVRFPFLSIGEVVLHLLSVVSTQLL